MVVVYFDQRTGAETNDFDQRMACGAPVPWLKYTTYSVVVRVHSHHATRQGCPYFCDTWY